MALEVIWRRRAFTRDQAQHGFVQTPYRKVVGGKISEDVEYLDALERGEESLPPGRESPRQRELHAENLGRVSS